MSCGKFTRRNSLRVNANTKMPDSSRMSRHFVFSLNYFIRSIKELNTFFTSGSYLPFSLPEDV